MSAGVTTVFGLLLLSQWIISICSGEILRSLIPTTGANRSPNGARLLNHEYWLWGGFLYMI